MNAQGAKVTGPTPIQRAAREAAERTAREQGLPAKITDRRIIDQVAAVIRDRPQRREAA